MESSAPASRRRRRGVVAAVSVGALVAVAALGAGVAVALEPTSAAGTVAAGTPRAHADALPRVMVGALAAPAGSLVGGEQQTLTGRGLDAVERITVGGMEVTEHAMVDGALTFTMPRSERYVAGPVPVVIDAGPVPVDGPELTYSYEVRTGVDRQMEYAFRYWKDYNLAEFGTFNPVGGDCVNFASQTLLARGWEMTDSWHNYDGGAQWTGPWIHVPSFDRWLRSNPQYGAVQLSFDQRDQVKVGDLVVFDWNVNNSLDHIQVVSAVEEVDGRIEIKMVGHNRDTDFRDLDETMTIDHPGGIGYFWSLPAS